MPEKLSREQKRAADFIAAGYSNIDVAEKVGVSESTIIRWKRMKGFQVAVEGSKTKAAAAQFQKMLQVSPEDEIEKCRNVEQEHLQSLDKLIQGLGDLCAAMLDGCDAEDISPRALPGLLKANVALIECRRTGADRITGMDLIVDELVKAEEIFSEKNNPS